MNPGAAVLSRTGAATTADFSNATGAPLVGDTVTGRLYWLNAAGNPFAIAVATASGSGAVADGIADDTAEILTAIAGSSEVKLDAGTYNFNPAVGITALPGKLSGAGKSNTTINIIGNGDVFQRGACSILEDLTIQMNGATYSGHACKFAAGAFGQLDRNIQIMNTASGKQAALFEANGGSLFQATGSLYHTLTTPGSGAAIASSAADVGAAPRRFINCDGGGCTLIDIAGMNNIHLTDCRSEGMLATAASGEVFMANCRIGSDSGALTVTTLNSISTGNLRGNSFAVASVVLNNCASVYFDNTVPNNNVTETGAASNDIIIQRTAYTPVWASTGVQPVLNNGTLTGFWWRFGKTIGFIVKLLIGSGTTFGTGTYSISLPFTPTIGIDFIAPCRAFDTGTTNFMGAATIGNGTAVMNFVFDNVAALASPTVPMTWANGDILNITGTIVIY